MNSTGWKKPSLDDPIQFIKGVGPKKSLLLKKLQLTTIEDLLYFLPFRYEDRSQFKKFRSTTANTPVTTQGTSSDIGDVKPATAERSMFSDATLTILTNKNNPVVECRFADVFPTSLSGLTYSQNQTDVDYLTAEVNFKYQIYEIKTL